MANPSRFLAALLMVYAVIAIPTAGLWGVIETSEARYAEVSREMLRSGDWLHPTLLSIHHYHKPPLTYWITSAAQALFGVTDFAARFFLQVSFILQVYLVYRIAKQLFDQRVLGLYAAIIYSGTPMVLISVRGLTTDAYLNTFILLTIFYWFRWKESGRPLLVYSAFVALGLCVLTKGPVGILIPVLTMLTLKPGERDLPRGRFHVMSAIGLFALISISWFGYLVYTDIQFLDYFVIRHTVERFTEADVFARKQPWWYFLCYAPLLALPWIMTVGIIRKSPKPEIPPIVRRILIYWVGLPILFFSVSSSKLVLYVLPAYAGLAIFLGWCALNAGKKEKTLERVFFWFMIAFGSVVFAYFLFLFPNGNRMLSLVPLLWLAMLLAIRFGVHWTSHKILLYSISWSLFLLGLSSVVFTTNELLVNSTKPVSDWIAATHNENKNIVVYNSLLPSVAYELDRDIISIADGNKYLNRETQFEHGNEWKRTLFDASNPKESQELANLFRSPSILISRGEIPSRSQWMANSFEKKEVIGKWIVHYN